MILHEPHCASLGRGYTDHGGIKAPCNCNTDDIKIEPTWKGLDSAYDVEAKTNSYDPEKFKPSHRQVKEDPPWTMDKSATNSQVGGTHYKDQGLQPFEITFKNFGYEGIRHSCYTKVQKYLTRDKNKHRENLEKAIHVLQIQLEYLDRGE